MAGHSKWANIRFRKGAQDAKRGKVFTKLIRAITIASREAGPDPVSNPALRVAIDKALSNNMTKDTIEKAVKRGSGLLEGDNVESIVYEGYGPGGVAVLVECMTDNRNRTVAEVRHAFSKHGGNLGSSGSVAYLFNKRGQICFNSGADEEAILILALERGADDLVNSDDGSFEIITSPEHFSDVKAALVDAGHEPAQSDVTMVPTTQVVLDRGDAEKMLKLLDLLEDLDDVQEVYSNADISDDILSALNS